MATPTRSVGASQTQENVIATFPVPYRGVDRRNSEVEIAREALWTGENLHLYQGELRQRPSWNLARDATIAAPPAAMGTVIGLFSATRPNSRTHFLFAGGTIQLQVMGSTGWILLASWGATRNRYNQVRMTEIAIGTPLLSHVVVCNGIDTPIRVQIPASGNPGPANVASLTISGGLVWQDVCTTSDRIIGITDTEVHWGEALTVDGGAAFPATAIKSLAESLDLCVAVRPIGTLNVGVWKERSVWLGQARGGDTASYFSWRVLRWCDGPAAPNALCQDSLGNFYWISKFGRLFRMDAQSFEVTTPGDGIWPITRKEMSPDPTIYRTCHAVYRPYYDEVWFFYRAIADGSTPE